MSVFVWAKNQAPGSANVANTKMIGVAIPGGFKFGKTDNSNDGIHEATIDVLLLQRSEHFIELFGLKKRTKANVLDIVTVTVRPITTPAANLKDGKEKHKNLNSYAFFVELKNCNQHFSKTLLDQHQNPQLAEFQTHVIASKSKDQILQQISTVEKEKEFSTTADIKFMEVLKFSKCQPNDHACRIEKCYAEYRAWNGNDFDKKASDHFYTDENKDVCLGTKHSNGERTGGGDCPEYTNEMLRVIRKTGQFDKHSRLKGFVIFQDFDGKNEHPLNILLLDKDHNSRALSLQNAYNSAWIKMFPTNGGLDTKAQMEPMTKERIEAEDKLHAIRITINPSGNSVQQRTKHLWQIVEKLFTDFKPVPSWGKVATPGHERLTDNIIMQWSPEAISAITLEQAEHRMNFNRQIYWKVCEFLKKHFAGKVKSNQFLPPFQYRLPDCPASVASYCGGNSFGRKMCEFISKPLNRATGLVPEELVDRMHLHDMAIEYAENGHPTQKFWSFADWVDDCHKPPELSNEAKKNLDAVKTKKPKNQRENAANIYLGVKK